MSYNPRIKNISGGTVDISGSLAATNVSTYVSASNANIATVVANSISASTVDSGTSLDITLKSVKSSIRKVTSGTSIQTTDSIILVDAASGSVGLTLPSASLVPGQRFTVKKVDSTGNIAVLLGSSTNITSSFFETAILSGGYAVDSGDNYGWSVALSGIGNRLIVGAPFDEIGGTSTGIIYLYVYSSGSWIQEMAQRTSLPSDNANIGRSVSINRSGSMFVAGASGLSSGGRAFVYQSGSSGWSESIILLGSLAISDINDLFGWSVATNAQGNRLVVGAPQDERVSATASTGLAYVFDSGSGGWTQTVILSGTLATQVDDWFGYSVAMNADGDRVVVGASQDERSGGGSAGGLAYIFISGSGTGWRQNTILSGTLANDASDWFGYSVAMNSAGDRVVVGAVQDERTGGSASSGLAYVFTSGSNGWIQELISSGTLAVDSNDNFGYRVSINSAGDRFVVGAYKDEKPGQTDSGLAYLYTSGSNGWTQTAILSGSNAVNNSDQFGSSVAMNDTGDMIAVGAMSDEINSSVSNAGTVYVFSPVQPIDSIGNKSLFSQNESVTVISDGTGSWSII